jgi:hypothetical protein
MNFGNKEPGSSKWTQAKAYSDTILVNERRLCEAGNQGRPEQDFSKVTAI